MSKNIQGFCPRCGSKGVKRERRLNGNDICENGCTYPSKDAIMQCDCGNEVLEEILMCSGVGCKDLGCKICGWVQSCRDPHRVENGENLCFPCFLRKN